MQWHYSTSNTFLGNETFLMIKFWETRKQCKLLILRYQLLLTKLRGSRPEVFCKKGVLRNFAKFTGKELCRSLFFNKVAGLRPATLLKRDSGTSVFLWILWNTFFKEHLRTTASIQLDYGQICNKHHILRCGAD